MKLSKVHTILTVTDLHKSKMFYTLLFDIDPIVDEENIVEFELNDSFVLGLQLNSLPEKLFDLEIAAKFNLLKPSSAEIYIECENAYEMHQKALQFGCLELSPFQERDWGHSAAYSVNHDGHVLAFAKYNPSFKRMKPG